MVPIRTRTLRLATTALGLALFALPTMTGCEEESIGKLSVKATFEPTSLDFGDVTVGTEKALAVTLKSTGSAVFTIDDAQIAPPFTVQGVKGGLVGKMVAAGTTLDLEVVFQVQNEGEATGMLVVSSGGSSATLQLRGNGVQRPTPVLSIDPTSLDFGVVEVGQESRKSIIVNNTGNAPGTIDRVTLQSTGADVMSGDQYRYDYGLPITIPVNTPTEVPIVFAPRAEGTQGDVMFFGTNGAGAPLQLTLTGEGRVAAGEILCNPASLDFGQVERGMSRQLMVQCSARGGPVRLFGASISQTDGYFSIPSPPGTADLNPNDAVTITVSYAPDGLPTTHTATLDLNYSGNQGNSTLRVPLSGTLIPPPPTATAISVILRWNTNFTDVDLHLTRPNAIAFSPLGGDCFYQNPAPDWGRQGDQTDDPFLDVDDTDGYGPENINLGDTARGNYTVYVHYFSDHQNGPSTATVEVYVAGNLAGTFTHNLTCDDVWTVGTVNWNGTGGTFNPSNAVQSNSGKGVCGI